MNCPGCSAPIIEKAKNPKKPNWGLDYICSGCHIEYMIKNHHIKMWGVSNNDLSLSGDKDKNEVIIWRIGSGNNNYLHKQDYCLPNRQLVELFLNFIGNKVN